MRHLCFAHHHPLGLSGSVVGGAQETREEKLQRHADLETKITREKTHPIILPSKTSWTKSWEAQGCWRVQGTDEFLEIHFPGVRGVRSGDSATLDLIFLDLVLPLPLASHASLVEVITLWKLQLLVKWGTQATWGTV